MRAHSVARLRRVLCAAQAQREGCGTRGFAPQTVLALFPVASCAARRHRGLIENQPGIDGQWRQVPFGVLFLPPRAAPSNGGGPWAVGEDCLRGVAPSSAALPLCLSSAETPAQPGDAVGATSFWLLFLGKTRKSTPARQARNTAPQLPQETSGKASEHSSAATHQFQREVEEQPAAGAVEPGRDRRRSLEAAGNRRR